MLTSAHKPKDVRIFHKEAKSLQKFGHDVTIIAPATTQTKTDTMVDGIKIRIVSRYKTKFLRPITIIQLILKGMNENAEIYHCHEPDALLAGVVLKILRGNKLVYDVHEYWSNTISEKFPDSIQHIVCTFFDFYERILCIFIDHIIVVSDEMIKKYNRYNKKTTLVANFPNPSFFKSNLNKKIIEKYADKFVFVYVGNIWHSRGTLETIKAFHLMERKEAYLLFVGPFSNSEYEKHIKNYVEENSLKDKVEFTGPVEYSDVPTYLHLSKVGLLLHYPTKRYMMPAYSTKLFEYMASGLPVIASNFPYIKKIIEETECGIIVNPTKTEDIANAMTWVMDNPVAMNTMSENSRKASEKYNWSNEEKKLLEVYKSLSKK